jgi:CBS domain-containing protein
MHPPITIEPTASLREAIDRMITHHIHRLVVVDPQDASAMPLGVLSTADIFVEMAGPDSVWQAAMA